MNDPVVMALADILEDVAGVNMSVLFMAKITWDKMAPVFGADVSEVSV